MSEREPDPSDLLVRLRRRRFRGIVTVFAAFWAVVYLPLFLLGLAIATSLPPILASHISSLALWISGVSSAGAVWVLYGRVPPSE